MNARTGPIAIYTPGLSVGGIGRMRLNIIRELLRRGMECHLLVADTTSPLMDELPPSCRVVRLPTTHPVVSIPYLARYMALHRPAGLLTDRLRLNRAAIRACRLVRHRPAAVMSFHNPLSLKVSMLPEAKRTRFLKGLRWCVEHNRRIVAVSQGVADDLVREMGFPAEKVVVVRNPVVNPDLLERARQPVEHPFFHAGVPVVVTAARMTEQKDFSTLLRAFKGLLQHRDARLLVLGSGKYFSDVERELRGLALEGKAELLGFQVNPYPFMARADLFVLSSRWEGLGNVLVEAMALGTPVVATDCPVGPREVLDHGRLGMLTPVGDPDALCHAMLRTLEAPPPLHLLREGTVPYRVDESTDGYLDALGLPGP